MSMREIILPAAVAVLMLTGLGALCAQEVSSSELIQRSRELDGQTVSYQGEVVGDVMHRGAFSWLNVHDGSNAVGVWVDSASSSAVRHGGSYAWRGDTVGVIGELRRSCPEHGGDLDIHAASLRVIKPGHRITEKISMAKARFVLILGALTLLIWISTLLKTR